MVAPLTGAWIEIEQLPGQMEIIESLPSRERGLKLQIIDQKTFASIVAPWSYVKIYYKLKWGFPHLNLPAAIRLAEAYDTALHNRLVTYNHSDYEFVSYCRMLPNIQKSNDMHDHNLES